MQGAKIREHSTSFILSFATVLLCAAISYADPVEDFYRNKQVRFITATRQAGYSTRRRGSLGATSASLSPASPASGSTT